MKSKITTTDYLLFLPEPRTLDPVYRSVSSTSVDPHLVAVDDQGGGYSAVRRAPVRVVFRKREWVPSVRPAKIS